MEIRFGGCLVDDITDFKRLAQLFTVYQPTSKRLQRVTMWLGTREDMFKAAGDVNDATPQLFRSAEHFSKPIGISTESTNTCCDETWLV